MRNFVVNLKIRLKFRLKFAKFARKFNKSAAAARLLEAPEIAASRRRFAKSLALLPHAEFEIAPPYFLIPRPRRSHP